MQNPWSIMAHGSVNPAVSLWGSFGANTEQGVALGLRLREVLVADTHSSRIHPVGASYASLCSCFCATFQSGRTLLALHFQLPYGVGEFCLTHGDTSDFSITEQHSNSCMVSSQKRPQRLIQSCKGKHKTEMYDKTRRNLSLPLNIATEA